MVGFDSDTGKKWIWVRDGFSNDNSKEIVVCYVLQKPRGALVRYYTNKEALVLERQDVNALQ